MTESVSPLQQWLDRFRAHDPVARNELIGHSRNRLRLLTRQMLRGFPRLREWEETSDVLQGALLRLSRALEVVPVTSPQDFLRLGALQIRRELLDLVRHHFGPEGPGQHLALHPPDASANRDDAPTVPEAAESSEDPAHLLQWQEVHEQIAALDESDRELFELLYYQGMTQPEAAALLAVPLRTLKRRWQSARLKLIGRLGNELPF